MSALAPQAVAKSARALLFAARTFSFLLAQDFSAAFAP
jgi:hypothetical protein